MCLSLSLSLSFFLVRSRFLITPINCLKGHNFLGCLCVCSNIKTDPLSAVSEWQSHVLSCPQTVSGQIKTDFTFVTFASRRTSFSSLIRSTLLRILQPLSCLTCKWKFIFSHNLEGGSYLCVKLVWLISLHNDYEKTQVYPKHAKVKLSPEIGYMIV